MIRAFTHHDVVVVVDAPDDDVRWLEEFLRPAFDAGDARTAITRGAPVVRVDVGPMPPAGDEHPGERVIFALDSGPVRLLESAIRGGTRYREPALRVAFDVRDDGRETTIRFAAEDRPLGRLALMRVVREHAHNHTLRAGGVVLHAAAVVGPGGALAIAGPRTAGKTTLLLRLLAGSDVAYLSNDRIAVPPPDSEARAIPTVVALRPGTRALLPDLAARLSDAGDFREHALERAARGPSAPPAWRDSWHVGPAQVCAALGRPLHAAAPLAAVAFLRAGRGGRTEVRPCAGAEARALVREALLGRGSRHYASAVFTEGDAPDDDAMTDRCKALASSIPCFSISMGEELRPDDVEAVLRGCLP